MQAVVLNNQSLADISIRYCGTVEALPDIAILNNISITESLVPGQIIEIPAKNYGNESVVNFFEANNIQPATALTQDEELIAEGESGIGFWILENNFIVQ